jgi:hypothetical protein
LLGVVNEDYGSNGEEGCPRERKLCCAGHGESPLYRLMIKPTIDLFQLGIAKFIDLVQEVEGVVDHVDGWTSKTEFPEQGSWGSLLLRRSYSTSIAYQHFLVSPAITNSTHTTQTLKERRSIAKWYICFTALCETLD